MLMTSFVPFLVVFTNAVNDRSAEDAALLDGVVSILQAIKHSSRELGRLCSLCTSFATYAASQVEPTFSDPTASSEDDGLLDFADAAMVDADILRELFGSETITRWDEFPGNETFENDFGRYL